MKVNFFFFGGGEGDLGLFWASCLEDQNMGSNEVKWIIISIEMDYMTPKTLDNMYHTQCFMNT